ncbi:MAG: arylesterase [Neisseriaceae bacterium]|nr:arylesterase [Neisseriaceae bacterium]
MNYTRRQLLLFPLAIAISSCSSKNQGRKLARGSLISALGDSLTYGYGASIEASYPTVLSQLTGLKVSNDGVSGNTSADVLKRLPEIISKKPKLILFGIGGNDFLRRVPEDETISNITNTIQQIKQNNIPVVLIAEPHLSVGALFGNLSDHPMYRNIAQQEKIPLLSNGWSDILSDKKLKSDQIHANEAGYRLFAQKMRDFLQSEGFL